ncbi:MAG: FAD-dependent oxidoreductase [Actinobacteria bacterium]|nr:FAD-dependent oxidoreductase [Actinomycetota bacterium]
MPNSWCHPGVVATRREFLRQAALATASAAGAVAFGRSVAGAAGDGNGRTVAIFGAGVAGLTAAQELAERGFAVAVYERDHIGGKAWSLGVPGSDLGGRPGLPGEHGFRFFPGFYRNLGDTMRRIPTSDGTVYDRLVRASTYRMSFAGRPDVTVPLSFPPEGVTPETFVESLSAMLVEAYTLPPQEALYFASKLFVYLTSCDERRFGQWDHVAWKDFIREDRMSAEYRAVASRSLVRNLAATKSDAASTHAIGLVGEASFMSLMGRGNDRNATFDRVLDGPTSEVWLDSWTDLLRRTGVTFVIGARLESLQLRDGRIRHAMVNDGRQSRPVAADWFVSAIPLERIAALLTPELLSADPGLDGITRLKTDWMSGLQFYLREPLPLANGHVNYVNSPFALTSISQAQFWRRGLSDYGDGAVRESFSTIISDWDTPGMLYGKAARDLSPPEIAREVFAQIQAHLNEDRAVLRDDMLHSWYLDPAIRPANAGLVNDTPLFIQDPGEWSNRPESVTAIPNFFLAGDWVRTHINVTTMDGANQGGRQAANGVLKAAGSSECPAELWPLYRPPEYEPYRLVDEVRYRQGLPNMFDPDQAAPAR